MAEGKNIKLSIIVPVYNVEKYIKKCISSLLKNGEERYEIIIVNDGTKDRSIDIVRETFDDFRIRVLEQENAGLSAARNHGIIEAKGEYIWCVDSDDWVETDEIPRMLDELNGIDALYFGSFFSEQEGRMESKVIKLNNSGETGRELACSSFSHCAPYYIIRREMLLDKNLFFKEGILHEDSLFTPTMIMQCKTVKCINKPLYHYRQRFGSIMNAPVNPKRINSLIYVINHLLELGDSIDVEIRYKWGRCIAQLTNELLFCTKKLDDKNKGKIVKEFVNSNSSLLDYLSHSSFNNRVMARVAHLFRGNLYLAYSILYKIRY